MCLPMTTPAWQGFSGGFSSAGPTAAPPPPLPAPPPQPCEGGQARAPATCPPWWSDGGSCAPHCLAPPHLASSPPSWTPRMGLPSSPEVLQRVGDRWEGVSGRMAGWVGGWVGRLLCFSEAGQAVALPWGVPRGQRGNPWRRGNRGPSEVS